MTNYIMNNINIENLEKVYKVYKQFIIYKYWETLTYEKDKNDVVQEGGTVFLKTKFFYIKIIENISKFKQYSKTLFKNI